MDRNQGTMKSVRSQESFNKQLFQQLPTEIAESFTNEQLQAIKQAFGNDKWRQHPVDIRSTISLAGLKFYLVILAGREKRSRDRLRQERERHPVWKPGNMAVIFAFFALPLAMTWMVLELIHSPIRSVTNPHPTIIPWLSTQEECEKTGRSWSHLESKLPIANTILGFKKNKQYFWTTSHLDFRILKIWKRQPKTTPLAASNERITIRFTNAFLHVFPCKQR